MAVKQINHLYYDVWCWLLKFLGNRAVIWGEMLLANAEQLEVVGKILAEPGIHRVDFNSPCSPRLKNLWMVITRKSIEGLGLVAIYAEDKDQAMRQVDLVKDGDPLLIFNIGAFLKASQDAFRKVIK